MNAKTATTDSLRDLALEIYIGLASRVYSQAAEPEHARPNPKVLAQMSFKLAQAFEMVDREVNPVAIAAAAAKAKAVAFGEAEMAGIDLDSLIKPR
jgi:hypothetical protein